MTALPLAEKLYRDCNINETDGDLKNASQTYLENHSEYALIDLLRNNYTISEVSQAHLTIARSSWKRIYTTNYDDVMELAFKSQGKLLSPVIMGDKIDQYKDKRTFCVHLNGFIDRLTPASLHNDFKLTDSSYLTTDFLASPWIDLFRSDIETSRLVIFIGFSLNSDLDLSRVISAHSNKDRLVFIVKPKDSQLLIKKLERYGHVFDIGIDGLADALNDKKLTYNPPVEDNTIIQSFTKPVLGNPSTKMKDKDVFELFFKGNSNLDFIHYSLASGGEYKYYLKRDELSEVLNYIANGGRNILIHSDLGNGKTLFIEGLCERLSANHYNVFIFKKYFENIYSEIEYLCTKVARCVIIIEKYSDHFDLIRKLQVFRTQDVIVILTERSIVNDTAFIDLDKGIFEQEYLTKDLNKLSSTEINELSEILTHYGLWGKHSSASRDQKRRIIEENCKRSFRLLLLYLLDSPDIKGRFDSILTFIEGANKSFFEASLLVLAASVFDFQMDLDKLVYILDDDLLNNPAFHNNDHLQEVINFNNSSIKVRSSILALSLLSQPKYHHSLINLLIKVFKKLDQRRSFDKNNHLILKSLVSFSRLQSIFNLDENSHFKAVVLNFYEDVKSTSFAAKNPFFWLQYAIARLSSRDYLIADKYFEAAYSYARSNADFDTFQIDNHYARHLLENEIYNGSIDSAMEQFLKAHNILSFKSTANENRHYPIRVAINYGKFYDKYFNDLTGQDQKVFLLSCAEIMQKINDYKLTMDQMRWNKAVPKCENELNRILTKNS